MQTVGIDLAAQPEKTGIAWVKWGASGGVVTDVHIGAADSELLLAMTSADKSGIDCPLGWPKAFVEFISMHQDDHIQAQHGDGSAWRRNLSYRVTDLHLRSVVPGIQGLSVSSDRIGVTAMRCASLLSELAAKGTPVAPTGAGAVVEVYPAASLARWGLIYKGYKGSKGRARREALVDELLASAPWLDLGGFEEACRKSDDALDAVVASMTARAAALRLTDAIPTHHAKAAAVEGWIALPQVDCPLETLVSRPRTQRHVRKPAPPLRP